MARNGKIARLPLHIRTELNQRLSEGEPGLKLVAWLNRLEPVRSMLKDLSGPRTITEQNLSEWRSGGYQDWLRYEEARQFTEDLAEQAGGLDEAADGKGISDRFAALLAVDMARLAKKFLERETDDEKRWERLKEISKELSRLRRDEHRAIWTWIKRQKFERQCEQEDYAEEEKAIEIEQQRKRLAAFYSLKQVKDISAMRGKEVSGSRVQGSEPKVCKTTAGTVALRKKSGQTKSLPEERDTENVAGPAGHSPAARKPERIQYSSAKDSEDKPAGRLNPSESDQIQPKPARPVLPSKPMAKSECEDEKTAL